MNPLKLFIVPFILIYHSSVSQVSTDTLAKKIEDLEKAVTNLKSNTKIGISLGMTPCGHKPTALMILLQHIAFHHAEKADI